MAVRDNSSPLGFGLILLFHSCLLGAALFLESFFEAYGGTVFWLLLGAGLVGLIAFCALNRGFFWDVFRSLRSAATLLGLLAVSCVLGTLIVQDLGLRRAGVLAPGFEDENGNLPGFEDASQSVAFAVAQADALLRLWPNEERSRLLRERVKLSPLEASQVDRRRAIFGDRAAAVYRDNVLGAKRREVERLTAESYARRHQRAFYDLWVVCRRLHLFDIFESWWLRVLLFLIAVNLTVGTLARAPWQRPDWGIAATHAGILIILTGGLLDQLAARGGTLRFRNERNNPAARVKAEIVDRTNRTITHLPFRVRLDRFATEQHHELIVESYDWTRRHDGSPWGDAEAETRPFTVSDTFPVREGLTRVFREGSVKVTVHAYEPRVFVRTVVDGEPAEPVPDAMFLARGGVGDEEPLAAWADVTVESPWGTERRAITPYDRPLAVGPPGERPRFLFGLVSTDKTRDRFSVLTILDHDGLERKTHAVRIGSPLVHEGWRFFQTSATTDEDGVGVSVISVTSSPGVGFTIVGCTVLTLGVGAVFFLRRRRREGPA